MHVRTGSSEVTARAAADWFDGPVTTRAEFLLTLPRKRVTAGALIRDSSGRVLLVQPTYRRDWLTPGGTVEQDEPPSAGAAREVLEELGVPLPIGRPLAMQWLRAADDPDGVLHFCYDGGTVDTRTIERFVLPPAELASFRFVDPDAVHTFASAETSARVEAALEASSSGGFVELIAPPR